MICPFCKEKVPEHLLLTAHVWADHLPVAAEPRDDDGVVRRYRTCWCGKNVSAEGFIGHLDDKAGGDTFVHFAECSLVGLPDWWQDLWIPF